MEPPDIRPHMDSLEKSIADLEAALKPLLRPSSSADSPNQSKPNLSSITSRLPLLDKAKLHVLLAYTIHSTLFSSLKLSGVDATQHPVYTTELARCKQYFEKIKKVEIRVASAGNGASGGGHAGGDEATVGPKHRVDKAAAARFVKHGVSSGAWRENTGNERKNVVTVQDRNNVHDAAMAGEQSGVVDGVEDECAEEVDDGPNEKAEAQSSLNQEYSEQTGGGHDSNPRKKRRKRRNKERNAMKKLKSSQPPKGSKEILQGLLSRGGTQTAETTQVA